MEMVLISVTFYLHTHRERARKAHIECRREKANGIHNKCECLPVRNANAVRFSSYFFRFVTLSSTFSDYYANTQWHNGVMVCHSLLYHGSKATPLPPPKQNPVQTHKYIKFAIVNLLGALCAF